MTGEAHNVGKLQREDKVNRALQMRIQGKPWRVIADELGYASHATLSRRVRDRMHEEVTENARELLGLEMARLDQLQEMAWGVAEGTDWDAGENSDKADTTRLRAIETVLKVMERRARLLGLDKAELQALEEARRSLSADQGALVVGALERIFNALNLTPEQRAMLPVIVPREVGRVVEEQEMVVIEGEVEDEQA